MEEKPYVLILSNTTTKPQSLMKLISKSKSFEEDTTGIIKCSWFIDAKYYTAEVSLISVEKEFQRTEAFNSKVEAIIIHVDTNKMSGLEDLESWEAIYKNCYPEIKLLVANYCNEETKVTKEKAIEWCLERGYEFIELYPAQQDDVVLQFEEKIGVDRVIEALQSHTWSNLTMKSKHKQGKPINNKYEDLNEEKLDGNFLDDDFDDFTELFSQLQTMRESLNALPCTQRKQCAEQMVTAFWKAIGGDEEELSDS